MIERWSRDQVLALAPDAASRKAAQGVAVPGRWPVRGRAGAVVYGECKGGGATPYLACADLTEPACRCSCPSRKVPCEHALGLLLLWSEEAVPAQEAAPQWVTEWLAARTGRAARRNPAARAAAEPATAPPTAGEAWRASAAAAAGSTPSFTGAGENAGSPAAVEASTAAGFASAVPAGDGEAAGATGGGEPGGGGAGTREGSSGAESVRHARVAAGLAELERWLADQVRQGLAVAAEHDWEGLAERLVDAQAPGVAGMVSRLARVRAEEGWPGRLLEEYALLHLLAVAYRRRAGLPPDLARTVLIRVGFPVTKEEVLTGPVVRDVWHVLGRRDETQDRLTARRVWLRGRHTGRAALILSFAPQGRPLDSSLATGTAIDADLAYYPGAAPLRALVAARHAVVAPRQETQTGARTRDRAAAGPPPPAPTAAGAGRGTLAGRAPMAGAAREALAGRAPTAEAGRGALAEADAVPPAMTVAEALDEIARVLADDPWTESWPLVLQDVIPDRRTLGGLPLHPRSIDPWRLIAVSGGHPVTVAAEWTPAGLRPLTTWDGEGTTVIL